MTLFGKAALYATARMCQSKAQMFCSCLLITDKTNILFLVSSLFLFKTDVLKPAFPQLQLLELDAADI